MYNGNHLFVQPVMRQTQVDSLKFDSNYSIKYETNKQRPVMINSENKQAKKIKNY